MKIRIAVLSSLMLSLLILGFQNCSTGYHSAHNADSNSKLNIAGAQGNGEGYGFASLYANLDVDGTCPVGAGNEKSLVGVGTDGKAYLVKQNCQDIEPVEVTSNVDLRAYDSDALVFGSRLFEKLNADAPINIAEVMCRGSAVTDSGDNAFADVFMNPTGGFESYTTLAGDPVPAYRGRVTTGVLAADKSWGSFHTKAISHAIKNILSPTLIQYLIAPDNGQGEGAPMAAHGDGTSGSAPYGLTIKDGVGRFFMPAEDNIHFLSIQNMDCYSH